MLPSTVRRLERGLIGAESIFERYPITVVSTDFIKSARRRHEFLRTCPDLVIIDEVHTCVADSTSTGSGRTQRYELMRDLAADPSRHLILASATPHSGKDEAFRNLLGLLKPELATVDLEKKRTENGWPSTSSSAAARTSAGTWTRTRPFRKTGSPPTCPIH